MTIEQAIDKIVHTVEHDIPKIIGNEAVNFALDNFRKEGFQGESFISWPARKKETPKSKGKPILVQSGALKRSIHTKKASKDEVIVGTGNLPYAQIQNEGGTITRRARSETFTRNRYQRGKKKGRFKKGISKGRGFTIREHTITIPPRPYLGYSPVLRRRINKAIIMRINKSLK